MADPVSFPWLAIVGIIASSSVVTGLLSFGLDYQWKQKPARERDARYAAQRLAILFETFAADCAELIQMNNLHYDSDGQAGKQATKLPDLAPFPDDIEWRTLNPELVNGFLGFPIKLKLTDSSLFASWDIVGDEDQLAEDINQAAARWGLRAWRLAVEARQKTGIPKADYVESNYDFPDTLRQHIERKRPNPEM